MKGKRDRKLIYVLIVVGVIILLTVFRFECRICKQTKIDIPHKINVFGIEYKVCSKCYKAVGTMFNGASDALKGLTTQGTNNDVPRNIVISVLVIGVILFLFSKPFREWVKRNL
jgi:hypothetical protein